MRYYSFILSKEAVKQFNDRVPAYSRHRFLREFIRNQFKMTSDLTQIMTTPKQHTRYPLYLPDETITIIDKWINKAKESGHDINRSTVMREVIDQINQLPGDISIKDFKSTIFYVEQKDWVAFKTYVDEYDRPSVVEDFIFNYYRPSPYDILKKKPMNAKNVKFRMDIAAFEKLDDLVEEMNKKSISRTALFRDVLKQLLEQFQETSPKQRALDEQLRQLISEYKTVANHNQIREVVNKYLE